MQNSLVLIQAAVQGPAAVGAGRLDLRHSCAPKDKSVNLSPRPSSFTVQGLGVG